MKRGRRLVAFAGVAITAMAVTSAWQTARADGSVGFGSYTLTSTAPGFEMWEDEPSANAHPEGGAQAPYSTSALNSGGLGYALSSVAWPGATEANADKVVLLLFPRDVGGVPVPDGVIGLVNTGGPLLSYPIRAEARSGTAEPDSAYDAQAAKLKAHADALLAQATATMTGAEGQAGFSFGNAETIATSVLNATAGQAIADSRISDIDIGGVVKIKSVTSNATASTDGATATASGLTVVQGMSIAGQDAYVDDGGVHIGSADQPANAVVNQIVNQALTQAGVQFFVSQPLMEQSGPTSTYTAGSLYIRWEPPGNPSKNVFFIALGGARVSVTATPGSAFKVPTVTPPAVNAPSAGTPSTPGRPGISSSPATSQTPAAAAPSATPIATSPIAATFEGLGTQAALGLLGTGLMFFGFKRAATEIVDRPPSTCPLETT